MNSFRRSFGPKGHLPLQRAKLLELRMEGGRGRGEDWANQSVRGFLRIGSVPEQGAHPPERDHLPRIPGSEIPEVAREICATRIFPWESRRDLTLWMEALLQLGRGWAECPDDHSRDAVIKKRGREPRCNPSFKFGRPKGNSSGLRAIPNGARPNGRLRFQPPSICPRWIMFPPPSNL